MQIQPWEANIVKIPDNLYFAKIKDKPLYLVMERVGKHNVEQWRRYATVQNDLLAVKKGKEICADFREDGSSCFSWVLDEVSYEKNELWVAYVTSDPNPRGIPTDMSYYSWVSIDQFEKNVQSGITDPSLVSLYFNENVKMFVTVVSSPNALITSHMGISCTIENLLGTKDKGLSIALHSFAAACMVKDKPDRQYMITTPVPIMESILVTKLPDAVFVGTKEMLDVITKRQIVTEKEYLSEDCYRDHRDLAKQSFSDFKNPCYFGSREDKENSSKNLLNYWDKHLPIISVGASGIGVRKTLCICGGYPIVSYIDNPGVSFESELVIYSHANPLVPWLVIDKINRQDYEWMFHAPFQPRGTSHYIAVDLHQLAKAAKIEALPVI